METTAARTLQHFPCAQCGADLAFAPGTDRLVCPYCGAENEVAPMEGTVAERDFRAALAALAGQHETIEAITAKCTNCGAETTLPPNVTADFCAFCGAPLVLQGASTRLMKPEGVLPFKITEAEAKEAFRKWIAGLWFAPNALKAQAKTQRRLAGLYIPHWTFDARTETGYTGRRGEWYYTTETYTTTENGKPVTRTRQVRHTRWYPASGHVTNTFDDLLVTASTTLPEVWRPKITPEEWPALVPYRDDYLAGFRTEHYTVELEQGFEIAQGLMQPAIDTSIRHDIGGDEQQILHKATTYEDVTFKHILIPVWLATYRFKEKPYRFAINARTGEVHGERPWSAVKIALTVLAVLLIIVGIAVLAQGSR